MSKLHHFRHRTEALPSPYYRDLLEAILYVPSAPPADRTTLGCLAAAFSRMFRNASTVARFLLQNPPLFTAKFISIMSTAISVWFSDKFFYLATGHFFLQHEKSIGGILATSNLRKFLYNMFTKCMFFHSFQNPFMVDAGEHSRKLSYQNLP